MLTEHEKIVRENFGNSVILKERNNGGNVGATLPLTCLPLQCEEVLSPRATQNRTDPYTETHRHIKSQRKEASYPVPYQ